jgi:hypothetical protein
MKWCLICAVVTLSVFVPEAKAANALFGCDATGSTCYFTIFYRGGAGGSRNFTMAGGQRDTLSGVDYSQDVYCVCINRQVPNSYNQCPPQWTTMGCKAQGNVKNGYNN